MKEYCAVCDKITEHYSIGKMDYGKIGKYEFYNCTICHGTMAKKLHSGLEIKLSEKDVLEE